MTRAVYFTDADGVRYRVLDAVMGERPLTVANPPASWASIRVFRTRSGMRWVYTFRRDETRAPGPLELARQLDAADVLPAEIHGHRSEDPG